MPYARLFAYLSILSFYPPLSNSPSLPPSFPLAYSNNFSSYGNGGGGTDFMEESHQALTPALEAYEEMLSILRLSNQK